MQQLSAYTVTVPAGANSVSVLPPIGLSLRAVQTPAALDGTTLTFEGGANSPGAPLYDGASIYSLSCGANRYIPITKQELFVGLPFLKITTNSSGSPINQSADRILTLFFASE